MLSTFVKIIAGLGIGFAALFGFHQAAAPVTVTTTLGDYNPTGGGTYRLQSSAGLTDSSISLSSFKEPVSNIPYTMTYLHSSVEYGTIEPLNNTKKEFISFTGITQNGDGSATLTGVTRALSFSYPFTASTTLQQTHSGQSIFILSNPPQYSNQFYTLANVSTSTNILIFSSTTPPRYDSVAAQASGTYIATTSELVSWAGLQAVSFAGTSNATEAVKGISELATALEQASSTVLGGSGAGLVMQSQYSTDTPQRGCATGYLTTAGAGCNIIAQLTGKLRQTWLNLAETFNFTATTTFATSTWSGNIGIATTSPYAALSVVGEVVSSYFTATSTTASSTLVNLVVSNNASTTNLTISGTCTGCSMDYTASSTTFAVVSGTITYTGSIPAAANTGLVKFAINSGYLQGTATITRAGLTSASVQQYTVSGDAKYTFAWSGSNFAVTEDTDLGSSDVSGIVYWYK